MQRLTDNRLVYQFVGHERKVGKFSCSRCPLRQPDKSLIPNAITFNFFIVLFYRLYAEHQLNLQEASDHFV